MTFSFSQKRKIDFRNLRFKRQLKFCYCHLATLHRSLALMSRAAKMSMPYQHVEFKAKILILGMTTLLTLAAMFSAIATTTPRVSYSSKLDIWMVFCVIFVFGTLMEFSLLIFLQKQIFAPKVILPSWKQLLCKPRSSPSTMGSMYRYGS